MLETVEMHTAGEPVRIVVDGWPPLTSGDLLARRREAMGRHDHLRRMLMAEPRGHADMYGALLVPPDAPDADLAVLFMHNDGWSTMCGHAVVALARLAVERGWVAATPPRTTVRIQCPCGLVEASYDGVQRTTGLRSVPAFVLARGAIVLCGAFGPVTVDLAYGGAFYVILPAAELGLDLAGSGTGRIIDAAMAVKAAAAEQLTVAHPDAHDLSFLYGTILTDGIDDGDSRNVCVFADGQVDRSPTGSGVTARLAAAYRAGRLGVRERRVFRSITDGAFTGEVVEEARAGPHPAVIVEVTGRAFFTGTASFTVEEDDPLGGGFLLRR